MVLKLLDKLDGSSTFALIVPPLLKQQSLGEHLSIDEDADIILLKLVDKDNLLSIKQKHSNIQTDEQSDKPSLTKNTLDQASEIYDYYKKSLNSLVKGSYNPFLFDSNKNLMQVSAIYVSLNHQFPVTTPTK